MLTEKTQRKRTRELNQKNFPSEAWFERLLFEFEVTGHSRNPPLIGKYFGDFVWFSHGIVVEIDGISHIGKEEYDKRRDDELRAAGFKVCRIKMGDRDHAERVIRRIKELIPIDFKELVQRNSGITKLSYIDRARKKHKKRNKRKNKAKQKHRKGKKIAKCFTDNNSKILADYNRRKKLWVHPRLRNKK